MELREEIRNLMAEVEQATGCPVVVTEDANLHTTSSILMASPDRPGHIILIHPNAPGSVDYYVAYYCRMIQRFFENPPEERFVFGYGDKGRHEIGKLVERLAIAKRLGRAATTAMSERLLAGLMTHLRSIPLGLRIDNWIFVEYPDLIEPQKQAIQPQLQDCIRSFADRVRKNVPAQVFDATMTINAAFTQFWADKWSQPELVVPFKASGYSGETLLKIWHDTPDSGRTDRALIDAWGAALNLSGWYVWVPCERPRTG